MAAGSVLIRNQYLVDLSYENPAAKAGRTASSPLTVEKSLDLQTFDRSDGLFNVDMILRINVTVAGLPVFLFEAAYRTVFESTEISVATLEKTLVIAGAHSMFEKLKNLLSRLTAEAGYGADFDIGEVDFEALYREAKLSA